MQTIDIIHLFIHLFDCFYLRRICKGVLYKNQCHEQSDNDI